MVVRSKSLLEYYTYKYILVFAGALFCLMISNYSLIDDVNELNDRGQLVSQRGALKMKEASRIWNNSNRTVKLASLKSININGISSDDVVSVRINNILVYEKRKKSERGIHLIVVNGYSGHVLDTQIFDTCNTINMHRYMATYLRDRARADTIMIFMVKDDAQFSLGDEGKNALKNLGSTKIDQLKFRGMWIFISQNGKAIYEIVNNNDVEGFSASPVQVKLALPLKDVSDFCLYGNSVQELKRREFCFQYIGFYSICNCARPSPIHFQPEELPNNRMKMVPVSIVASNRPHYLYKTLAKLLSSQGVSRDMVTVYIDGFHDQVVSLLDILDVRYVEHSPADCILECQIHQNYKFILDTTAARYPRAEFMMILEEDLLVSDDVMDYFNQLLPVLSSDDSLLCISAWNDNSYQRTSHDPAMVYRVETMPGLGWVIKRDLYLKEFAPIWPNRDYPADWDMWMRQDFIRKSRECLVPDISRTFHFGKVGAHIFDYGSDKSYGNLFDTRMNTKTGNIFDISKLYKNGYEHNIIQLIKKAQVLDHTKDPCNSSFIPSNGLYYVMYIKWRFKGDAETWLNVATCLNLWDKDVRGVHKHMWRFWHDKKHIIVISSSSPYFVYKPASVEPIFISNSRMGKKEKMDMSFRQGYVI